MRKTPNTTLIGIFTIVGITIFVLTLSLFMKDKLKIDKDNLLVMYFDGSIKGLNIGSSVFFKGVQIGKVVMIDLTADETDMNFKAPVFIEVNPEQLLTLHKFKRMSRDEIVKKLIEHGLRAKLIQGNLLTGQLNIELEINPHSEAIFRGDNFSSQGVMEIPTLLSAFSEFSKEIHDIKIKSTVNELNKLLTTFNQYAPKILDEAHKISVNVNKKLEKTNGNGEDPVNNFNQTLKDVSDMAKSFKNLADYLERNPEALLRGKGR